MILEQRVFHQSTDISVKVNDFRAGTYTFTYISGQYLYIGSIVPFNNLYVELGVLNIVAATTSVDIWYGHAWTAAVDLVDETVGLTASGRIQWNTDKLKGWDVEQFSADVTGLPAGSRVYDMYWTRLSWNATLTATATLKYIGQKFSDDSILYSYYPDLNNSVFWTAFASGKTTWDEQHYMAAERIIADLKKRNIIKSRGQIMDYILFREASCHKVAEIVYQACGSPYFDQLKQARSDYNESMNPKFFNVDTNLDGALDVSERKTSTQFLTR